MADVRVAKLCPTPGEPEPAEPFFLIERYDSIDGPRTRVCGDTFKTQAQAHARAATLLIKRAGMKS